jgi:hypothetical protein
VPQANGISPHQEGNNIYGAYGRIDDFLVPHSNIEPFFLWRVQPAEVVEPATSKTTGKENERAFGVRIKAQNLKALDYSGEVILETGTVGPQPIRASAAQAGAAYQFLDVVAKPRVFVQSDYATGNGNPKQNGSHTTFDTIYPTAHDRFGITDLFGWQNIETARAGTTVEPHRRLTFTVQGLDFGRLMRWTRSTTPRAARSCLTRPSTAAMRAQKSMVTPGMNSTGTLTWAVVSATSVPGSS